MGKNIGCVFNDISTQKATTNMTQSTAISRSSWRRDHANSLKLLQLHIFATYCFVGIISNLFPSIRNFNHSMYKSIPTLVTDMISAKWPRSLSKMNTQKYILLFKTSKKKIKTNSFSEYFETPFFARLQTIPFDWFSCKTESLPMLLLSMCKRGCMIEIHNGLLSPRLLNRINIVWIKIRNGVVLVSLLLTLNLLHTLFLCFIDNFEHVIAGWASTLLSGVIRTPSNIFEGDFFRKIQLNSCNSNSCNSKDHLNRTNSSVLSEFTSKPLQENSFNSNSHNSKNHLNRTNFRVTWTFFIM